MGGEEKRRAASRSDLSYVRQVDVAHVNGTMPAVGLLGTFPGEPISHDMVAIAIVIFLLNSVSSSPSASSLLRVVATRMRPSFTPHLFPILVLFISFSARTKPAAAGGAETGGCEVSSSRCGDAVTISVPFWLSGGNAFSGDSAFEVEYRGGLLVLANSFGGASYFIKHIFYHNKSFLVANTHFAPGGDHPLPYDYSQLGLHDHLDHRFTISTANKVLFLIHNCSGIPPDHHESIQFANDTFAELGESFDYSNSPDWSSQCEVVKAPVLPYGAEEESGHACYEDLLKNGFLVEWWTDPEDCEDCRDSGGKLRDGRTVAIKRFYKNNYRLVEQFINEVYILSSIRHQNLVTLYGCTSRSSRELLLVYEYVPNGTVADHLHGCRACEEALTWPLRMSIAIETADALTNLHAVTPQIIHRDVKTTNILLDRCFHVKVGDFGLSRLFPVNATHVSTAPQGTPGYVDPDYHQCYQLTDKSDVYSFGVMLVELISSKPAVDISRPSRDINLANMAIDKIQKQELDQLVDPKLCFRSDSNTRTMIERVAGVAFRCLQTEKEMRPAIKEVLEVLKGIEDEGRNGAKGVEADATVNDEDCLLWKKSQPHSPDSVATQ
ncbi:hypothetical protein GW17_00047034 [Ensete ventricosum]|nr:hypothetical protein GW17_00047034 [Ensete ventricosum]